MIKSTTTLENKSVRQSFLVEKLGLNQKSKQIGGIGGTLLSNRQNNWEGWDFYWSWRSISIES
jgi:hypothetical protein